MRKGRDSEVRAKELEEEREHTKGDTVVALGFAKKAIKRVHPTHSLLGPSLRSNDRADLVAYRLYILWESSEAIESLYGRLKFR